MRYYIGIDGGGTKTDVCAVGIDDFKLQYAGASGVPWRELGASAAARIIGQAVHELIGGDFTGIGGVAVGLPCYGESGEGDRAIEQAISEVFAGIPVYFANDVEAAWAGSLALKPGINIVAGTGAISFGRDLSGNSARCGGWSEFFGDEGSCYWIGRRVMQLFSRQSDGRDAKDELYDIVYREFGLKKDIEFIDIVHEKYFGKREKVASLQILAEKAAKAGARSAIALYEEAAQELSRLAYATFMKLDFGKDPWTVSYSGGLFKSGDLILPRFKSGVGKIGGELAAPEFSPVQGAVLLAFQNFCPGGLETVKEVMRKS